MKAQADMALVKSLHRDGEFIAERLAIHILLAQSRAREALRGFERLRNPTRIDNLLKREILAELSHDPSVSISERQRFDQQYKDTFGTRSPFYRVRFRIS